MLTRNRSADLQWSMWILICSNLARWGPPAIIVAVLPLPVSFHADKKIAALWVAFHCPVWGEMWLQYFVQKIAAECRLFVTLGGESSRNSYPTLDMNFLKILLLLLILHLEFAAYLASQKKGVIEIDWRDKWKSMHFDRLVIEGARETFLLNPLKVKFLD